MGEAKRRRDIEAKREVTQWSFPWLCANCEHDDGRFDVTEWPGKRWIMAKCRYCTYRMEVGPHHREAKDS
jgi:transcription elongation factor Elf1